MNTQRHLRIVLLVAAVVGWPAAVCRGQSSVVEQWNEQLLAAIRVDTPRPTVHARNLFHASAAMYDAWAAYDANSVGYVYRARESATDVEAARSQAASYAAYRLMSARFAGSPGAGTTLPALRAKMTALGYDPDATSTAGASPAAVGNRIAAAYLARGATDGSNEAGNYADTTGYVPSNPAIVTAQPGAAVADPNRWSPLTVNNAAGTPVTQSFLTPQWGGVTPFAVRRPPAGAAYGAGMAGLVGPPTFGSAAYKAQAIDVIRRSGQLDPNDGAMMDASPRSLGNSPLGTNAGTGRAVNPVTGQPYASNPVKRGDYARLLAEFWADGPRSETPPGHWNAIANAVSDNPLTVRRIGGTGPAVNRLEWDAKLGFAMNAALYDASIVAWDNKRRSDSVRPIAMVRYMGGLGQSSDPAAPRYDPNGLPLMPGVVEQVTAASAVVGGRHDGLTPGDVAIFAWRGHSAVAAAAGSSGVAGAGWVDARKWDPYQLSTFVTPAFPGYISGHSTFSRSAAEVLTLFSGSEYFPGGLGEYAFDANGSIVKVERGPSQATALQWATYYDAADEAGLSRLYGGIHIAADDFDGRILGSWVGRTAFAESMGYFNGTVPEPGVAGVLVVPALALLGRRRRRRGPPSRAQRAPIR